MNPYKKYIKYTPDETFLVRVHEEQYTDYLIDADSFMSAEDLVMEGLGKEIASEGCGNSVVQTILKSNRRVHNGS